MAHSRAYQPAASMAPSTRQILLLLGLGLLLRPCDSLALARVGPVAQCRLARRRRGGGSSRCVISPRATLAPAPGEYGAEQITVLEGLEPVRKRPGMYIGSTGARGLHHLVFEVVDNSVDEALAGHATAIQVDLNADGSVTVRDDGRGIPCDVHSKTGRPALETVLTVLHAGGKFGASDSGYKVSAGLHGVGVSVVNALSDVLDVEVIRDGKRHAMQFSRGKVTREMSTEPVALRSGTALSFQPDRSIFHSAGEFDFETLAKRFDEQAFLNAGLNITLVDWRRSGAGGADGVSGEAVNGGDAALNGAQEQQQASRVQVCCHEGGLAEYVALITEGKTPLFTDGEPTLVASTELKGVSIDVAMRWSSDVYTDSIVAFANGVHTPNGGTHVDGLKAALTRVLNAEARAQGKRAEKLPGLPGDFLREGLCAVLSVKLPEAEFEGQTKAKLGNPEVRAIVSEVVGEALSTQMQERPRALAAILDKALAAARAAEAAKAARDLVRRKTVLGSSVLPGKLADCASKDAEQSEVFIVEGDSAGGSAKQGRQRQTQAVLPLRGKILNVEKADDASMYGNTEIQALITALGLGIKGDEFQPSQLRYHKIIIMTDADVDGAHIRTLLLTFLYRYCREVVEGGFVYIAYPPLYKLRKGQGKPRYAYSDAERDSALEQMGGKPSIQRFKGLGEMMPQELWSTTMDPATRMLKRVTADDAVAADRVFSMLMGSNIAPRKQFIKDHAATLDFSKLDV